MLNSRNNIKQMALHNIQKVHCQINLRTINLRTQFEQGKSPRENNKYIWKRTNKD